MNKYPTMAEVHQGIASAIGKHLAPHEDVVEIVPWLEKALDERDEWKRKADDYSAGMEEMAADLNEWKRRAEAAEAVQGSLQAALDMWKTGKRSLLRDFKESGPGIAAKRPDNSIDILPEDLLCDEA